MRAFICLLGAVAALWGQESQTSTSARDLTVTVGKSVLVDSPAVIERVAVSNGDLAEAVVINPHEVMVNGRSVGETSLIVWQQGGNRLLFDVAVRRSETHIDAVRREMALETGSEDVSLNVEGDAVFLRGSVPNLTVADRALAIAATLGKPVNLLRVAIPGTDKQILLKVRFADIDKSAVQQLGLNILSTGAANTIGRITTGQMTPPAAPTISDASTLSISDALNIFLFRRDLDLGVTIRALQARNLAQILAEPNVLALNGRPASFLAGGEFPYPTLQGGGGGLGAVTIQFREFGVRINFIPTVTPRGTIRLSVTPEVSSLDYANGLVFQGFTIPGLSTRRVQTEIELDEGQSFAIAGLLDNRDTELLSRIPGIGDIPFFGKLFRSRQITRSKTELLVLVTPEIVNPIPKGQPLPELNMPGKFLETPGAPPRTPGMETTGTSLKRTEATIPVEELVKSMQPAATPSPTGPIQYVPVPMTTAPASPGQSPAPGPVKPAAPVQ